MSGSAVPRIELCGDLVVEVDGRTLEGVRHQGRLLIAYLASRHPRPVRRDELIEVLWEEGAPSAPNAALSTVISRVRRALGADVVRTGVPGGLSLPPDASIDLHEARESLAEARSALSQARFDLARERALAALGIVEKDFLPGFEAPWIDSQRRYVEDLRIDALECLGEAALGRGDRHLAERAGRSLIELAPYRESGYRFVMEALAARGNVAEALRTYERVRRLLRDELGVAPEPGLQRIHSELLNGRAERDESSRPATHPLPRALTVEGVLVGRDSEMRCLTDSWRAACSARPRLILLEGEAGIGKTHLCAELARLAATESALVLYGRCLPEPLAPCEPFVESLQGRLRAENPQLSELRSLVCDLSRARPVLLVLDDLELADRSTLRLLEQILRCPAPIRLLVLGTARTRSAQLDQTLASLRRDELAQRLPLAGLDEGSTRRLVTLLAGKRLPKALTRLAHEATAGNPRFIRALAFHLGRRDRPLELQIPEEVREAVDDRLAVLDPLVRNVLTVAAVIGREFSLSLLQAVTEVPHASLLDALDEAVAAGLVVELPGPEDGYRFVHALTRDVLYRALGNARRAQLHRKIASELPADHDRDRHLAVVAHHLNGAADSALAVRDRAAGILDGLRSAGRESGAQLINAGAAATLAAVALLGVSSGPDRLAADEGRKALPPVRKAVSAAPRPVPVRKTKALRARARPSRPAEPLLIPALPRASRTPTVKVAAEPAPSPAQGPAAARKPREPIVPDRSQPHPGGQPLDVGDAPSEEPASAPQPVGLPTAPEQPPDPPSSPLMASSTGSNTGSLPAQGGAAAAGPQSPQGGPPNPGSGPASPGQNAGNGQLPNPP